jgi:glycosyltransferase involved in cell wall biosynthesis
MGDRGPTLAVVLPVFKHPGLVVEAVHSALADPNLIVVAVNDGCPYAQTDEVLGEFAAAEPRLKYIRKSNGGLSSARNAGIEFVMRCLPQVEAIYLLDADNRLHPGAVTRAWEKLRGSDADWLYPGIYMFGIRHKYDFEGDYSLLANLAQNTCEAGSLVRRKIFEAGLRFDESMKKGYEDWDFWLACAAAGFRGLADNDLGLLYRKRAESMLRDSARDHEEIMAYMRGKWKKLFHPRHVVDLECQEAPRYAVVSARDGRMREATDPVEFVQGNLGSSDFLERIVKHNQSRLTAYFPPFLVFGEQVLLDELSQAGLLRSVFWLAEHQLDSRQAVCVTITHGQDGVRLFDPQPGSRRASLLFVSTRLFLDCATDTSLDWARRELTSTGSAILERIGLQMPLSNAAVRSAHVHHSDQSCLDYLRDLRDAAQGALQKPAVGERERSFPAASERFRDTRKLAKAGPIYPVRKKADERRAVFAMPVASYGGVEQVAYAMAKEFRQAGYKTRLLVAGSAEYSLSKRNGDAFDEVLLVANKSLLAGGTTGANESYYGQPFMPCMTREMPELQGALWDADVFINCHASSLNGLAGELKRNGCVTVSSVHVLDKTGFGRQAGHPYFSLAYEHGYDVLAPCSESMGAWLQGMGVPAEKVIPVPNAPDLEPGERIPNAGPLRVLVLGRFDYQKGLDRLEAVIRSARERELEIEWKLVGSALLGDHMTASGLAHVPALSVAPPVYSREDLVALLSESDVLLLLSRWEGLPLTLLEAMRCGAVPVSTDVGAVSEALHDGQNGFLVREGQPIGRLAAEITNRLEHLCRDPQLRIAMSTSAVESVRGRTWAKACAALIDRCNELLAERA